ncbi:MAG: hypothetical protein KBC91_03970, partial [Candidatus Omnitrophica bacterium]|nr:hypothetical protein [Candidatus Omnitrophota bacterium]
PYGQLRDEIVAPYASMLAVNYFPKQVVSNLQALEKMDARPETEAKRTTDVWSAFADKRSVFAAPYAFIHKGAVFLIAQDGAVLPLKDYLIPDSAGRILDLKSDRELNLFFKALNLPDYLGQVASVLVQSVSAGTGVSKELEKIMGGSEQLQVVLALASHTGEFQLGEIRLKDGTVFKTLWLDQKGVWIPKAIATKTELYFLNAEGSYEKLNTPLDNTDADQSVTGYDRDRAAFVAAVTGHAASLKDGAVLLKQGTRFSEALRDQTQWTPLDAAEVAALATHVQDFKPAKLFFVDGTELELALGRPGIRWVPWAAAQNGEVYFFNSEGVIENLSRYVKKTSASKKVFPYDSVVLHKLLTAAKISAVAGPLPQGVPQKEQAFPADSFNPDLASRLRSPEARLGLQALAVSAGLYQPGKIQLPDGTEYSILWTLAAGINVPWAVATESDILFISDHKKLVSLKGYLSQNQLTLEAVDSASALKFFAAGGLLSGSASKGAVNLDEVSFGTAMRSTLADEIQEESMRADLLGLAVKAGLADVPLAKLSQGAQIPALWTDQPASPTPWALANTKEVVFISPARGTLETVSSYLDQNQINQPISNLDRRTLVVFAEDLGFKPEPGKSAQDYFKQAVFGTFLKPSLRQDVADSALRQALLGLTATAGLYTPAKIELADGSSASLLLVERGDQWLAVAAATDGKVFYLGRDHQSHRLNEFENKETGLAQVSSYQRFPLDILAAGLGYSLRQGESLADRVQSVTLGTSRSESLAQSLDDAEILPELEALARHAHVTQPGQVQLVDKTAFGVAFSDFLNRQVPYAAVTGGGTTDVTFLNREGLQRNLSQYFDNTLLGQKTQAYDRLSLKDLLVKAGVPIKGPAPEVILGTVVKSELLAQVSSSEQMSELLALAGKAGLYQPGRIEMKDVGTLSVLLIKQGELYQPWAVASGKNLYFKNKKNGIESLDRFITKGTPQVLASGADVQSTLFLSGKDFTGAPASIDYRAMQQTRFNPGAADLAISADQAAELVGLASAAGAYDPVHVKLTETKIAHYGFRDSVDWKSGKVTLYYLTPSQGMAFLSLANFLYDGVVWKAFSENAKMKTALEKLREIDRTQNLLGDQAQRGCMLLPKNQTRAA